MPGLARRMHDFFLRVLVRPPRKPYGSVEDSEEKRRLQLEQAWMQQRLGMLERQLEIRTRGKR